jgi:hypothetical protein
MLFLPMRKALSFPVLIHEHQRRPRDVEDDHNLCSAEVRGPASKLFEDCFRWCRLMSSHGS